jgi:hypothetical protein
MNIGDLIVMLYEAIQNRRSIHLDLTIDGQTHTWSTQSVPSVGTYTPAVDT